MRKIATIMEGAGRFLVRAIIVTVGPIALGALTWTILTVIGGLSNKICSLIEQCWNVITQNWSILLVFIFLLVIVLTIVDAIRPKKRRTTPKTEE